MCAKCASAGNPWTDTLVPAFQLVLKAGPVFRDRRSELTVRNAGGSQSKNVAQGPGMPARLRS